MKEYYPSKELADALNLPALYTEYNVDEKELHDFYDKHSDADGNYDWNTSFKELKKVHTKLKKNNSNIRHLKLNNKSDYIYLWAGMVSKFNIDDIEYFLAYSDSYELRPHEITLRQRALDEKLNKIPRKSKKYLGTFWVLSPKTITLLEDFIKKYEFQTYGLYNKKTKKIMFTKEYDNFEKPKNIKDFIKPFFVPMNLNTKDLQIKKI